LTREVACLRHLDLDNVRAEMRELVAAERSREDVGEIENANIPERLRLAADHGTSLTSLEAGMSAPLRDTQERGNDSDNFV
jgi:hypothetical protein